ncbi:O-antigen ligase family protein [Jeotgalibacillus sp. ET6]|uniref:O-antigen ligase family protein n=1 Tax=Jeotgalibacillus sp. ET6 TaxID=3037260 RepID=UPI002418A375|nr:O-antigen ligase family protein [Jeotgalibacillus sp. ET6]MDG5471573.1 O-antigen ligase family protein [Jeotgalibacillus sp. ET6]
MLHALKTNNKLVLFFFYFIALQPVIDILTTFSIVQLNTSATVGVFVRIIYMAICALFLLLHWKSSSFAKLASIYLLAWGVFILAHLGVNYMSKPNFYFMEEVKFLIKLTYFNVVLLNFAFLFAYFSEKKELGKKFFTNVMISSLIIGLVMLISILTNTSQMSYSWTKVGYTGWFFAGNELGAILAVILPILLYFAIVKTTRFKDAYMWIPVILAGYSLLMIGTKVGFGAVAITLAIGFASILIALFKKRENLGNLKISAAFTLALLLVLGAVTPIVPVFQNTYAHIELLENQEQEEEEEPDDSEEAADPEAEEEEPSRVSSLMYSSRDRFLYQYNLYYDQAPIEQKIVGMGYGGNFEEAPKMIEMDYSDVFYSTGLIGTILYFLPLLYFAVSVLNKLKRNILMVFQPLYALLISSIVLGLGIAHFAGHVFTAPAVSIYLALVIAYFHHYVSKDSRVNM